MLTKYSPDPSHILQLQLTQVDKHLSSEREHVAILDQQVKKLRHTKIASIKMIRRNKSSEEATWEPENITPKKTYNRA